MANVDKKQIKIGEPGYINQNCWLARNVGHPPSARCQYCELKFRNCLLNRFLIISSVLISIIIVISFIIEGSVSKLLIISVFTLITVYGYFFEKSTESIIEANFAERKAKESLEELTKNLQHKVAEQTKDLRVALEAEKIAKEKIDAIRVEDEAILSSIGEGVIAVDNVGKIMFMNKSAEQMLGLKSGEAIGRKYDDILSLENTEDGKSSKKKCFLYDVLKIGKKVNVSSNNDSGLYYSRKDKTKFPVSITATPIILNGKIVGAVDVFRDITIERQIDKAKTEFVSLASHQLRTPLSAIKWYSEFLLRKKMKTFAKQKKYLEEIYNSNERMIKLIDVMLSISRMEVGKVKINPTYIDPKKLIKSIIEEQKFIIKKKKQKIIFDCQKNIPEVFVDANLARMIFQNLISNSVKYTPENGTITCIVSSDEKQVLFKIKDTGIGIPKDQQKRVFEKLFRASNAFSHDPEGNGLGLYLVKATTENLGGKICFKSEEEKGTTFFVSLPIKVEKHF